MGSKLSRRPSVSRLVWWSEKEAWGCGPRSWSPRRVELERRCGGCASGADRVRDGSGPSRRIEIEGRPIHYVDEGEGPPLLFVHAGTGSFLWRDVIVRLRERFRCVGLDVLGAGPARVTEGESLDLGALSRILESFVRRTGPQRHHLGHARPGRAGRARDRPAPARPDPSAHRHRVVRLAARARRSRARTDAGTRPRPDPRAPGRRLVRRIPARGGPDAPNGAERPSGAARLRAREPGGESRIPRTMEGAVPRRRAPARRGRRRFPMADAPDLVARAIKGWWREEVFAA